jgi:hypothetical protein
VFKGFHDADYAPKKDQMGVPAKSRDGVEFLGFLPSLYRSGSQWLYYSFKDAYPELRVHHEADMEIMLGWPGLAVGFKVAQWADVIREYYGPETPIILLVRHPLDVARSAHRSGIRRGDIAIQHWTELNQHVLDQDPLAVYKIEDIWADPNNLHDIARMLGLPFRKELTRWANHRIGQSKHNVPGAGGWKLTPKARELARLFQYDV